jgi:flagellar M-ring protein FliF
MLPTGKGPAGGGGGLAKVMAQWQAMSTKMKILTVGSLVVVLLAGITFATVTAANKPVPLYPTALTPSDVAEISRVLNEHNTPYSLDGATKIMVHPGERSRIVGMLIGYGLPHRPLGNQDANGGGGMSPKTESEKKAAANQELQFELIDQLRQYDVVADAYVNIVPADDDELPQDRKPAKATVFLKLKPGSKPTATQIEAIVNLVAYSVNGLMPENVKVTDTTGFVWTGPDGKIAARNPGAEGGGDGFENENIALKKAYEKRYYDKIALALDPVLGHDKYTVTVDADLDFTQTKIESTSVGDPGGNNSVTEVQKTEKEIYKNNPGGKSTPNAGPNKSAQQVSAGSSILQGKNGDDTNYEKVRIETKTDNGKVAKTAVIPAGALKKVTATVAVDGKYDQQQMAGFQSLVSAAIGLDATRGDTASVVPLAFNRAIGGGADVADMLPADAWNRHRPSSGATSIPLFVGMLIPTTILLSVLAVFLLRQRKVTMDKSGLILATSNGSTTSDISDLLSDKIGRSTVQNQTTRANNTEQLEKLAKEKPTKVAELLKSTWLSDKER